MRWLVAFVCMMALGALAVVGCGAELCENVVCDDGNECTDDVCDPADGTCDNTAVEDGTECGDGAGTCEAGSCVGTFGCSEQGIRQAIVVGGGPHTFECDGLTPVVTEAEIVIDNDVILDGEGDLRVDGNDDHRVFSVAKDVTAELRGITVTKGKTPGPEWPESAAGGGIYNSGSLTLTDTTVSGNSARGGGGIFNDEGPLTLVNSTVSGNSAVVGGGISNDEGPLTLVNSTVSGNSAERSGGGISNHGTMTLTSSRVSGNAAEDGGGGGIDNGGTMTMTDSTVSGNTGSYGGGISNSASATLTLTNSTVSGNAGSSGGGIGNGGLLTLTNSTVSGNTATTRVPGWYAGGAGGISNSASATLTLTNSTVSGNAADSHFGGIASIGAMTLTNSTVSGNEASEVKGISYYASRYIGEDTWVRITTITNTVVEGDCVIVNEGPITTTSLGYNIESPGNTCGFNQTGDQPGVTEAQLNLGPLTYNGGPTVTHKPGDGDFGVGSFAIDQIPEADCEVTEDQRGEPRPETGGTMCDVGAVEVQ